MAENTMKMTAKSNLKVWCMIACVTATIVAIISLFLPMYNLSIMGGKLKSFTTLQLLLMQYSDVFAKVNQGAALSGFAGAFFYVAPLMVASPVVSLLFIISYNEVTYVREQKKSLISAIAALVGVVFAFVVMAIFSTTDPKLLGSIPAMGFYMYLIPMIITTICAFVAYTTDNKIKED